MKSQQYQQTITTNSYELAMKFINDELKKALEKFPLWPKDTIHSVAIMQEESGETMKAALEYVYNGKSENEIVIEAAQTAAMAIRIIIGVLDSLKGNENGN